MSNRAECPNCRKRLLHLNIENVIGLIGGESKARCLSFSCIHCHTVLGVKLDARSKQRPRRVAAAVEK